jgi:hypothetical protein
LFSKLNVNWVFPRPIKFITIQEGFMTHSVMVFIKFDCTIVKPEFISMLIDAESLFGRKFINSSEVDAHSKTRSLRRSLKKFLMKSWSEFQTARGNIMSKRQGALVKLQHENTKTSLRSIDLLLLLHNPSRAVSVEEFAAKAHEWWIHMSQSPELKVEA